MYVPKQSYIQKAQCTMHPCSHPGVPLEKLDNHLMLSNQGNRRFATSKAYPGEASGGRLPRAGDILAAQALPRATYTLVVSRPRGSNPSFSLLLVQVPLSLGDSRSSGDRTSPRSPPRLRRRSPPLYPLLPRSFALAPARTSTLARALGHLAAHLFIYICATTTGCSPLAPSLSHGAPLESCSGWERDGHRAPLRPLLLQRAREITYARTRT